MEWIKPKHSDIRNGLSTLHDFPVSALVGAYAAEATGGLELAKVPFHATSGKSCGCGES